jgi:hypothetical protein
VKLSIPVHNPAAADLEPMVSPTITISSSSTRPFTHSRRDAGTQRLGSLAVRIRRDPRSPLEISAIAACRRFCILRCRHPRATDCEKSKHSPRVPYEYARS